MLLAIVFHWSAVIFQQTLYSHFCAPSLRMTPGPTGSGIVSPLDVEPPSLDEPDEPDDEPGRTDDADVADPVLVSLASISSAVGTSSSATGASP